MQLFCSVGSSGKLSELSESVLDQSTHHETRDGEDSVIFEVFETSPSPKDVLAADGALLWDFPDRSAEIPWVKFCETSFQKSLALFLEQAAQEPLQRFAARTRKAGASVIEIRDTTDPVLFLEFLMPLLAAIGIPTSVPKVRKRVRDDVQIYNAELPWRRDPSWLILRVAIQRQLCLTLGNECGRACYKFLICAALAQLLEDCVGQLSPERTLTLRAKLCRRLAKMELEKSNVCESASAVYKQLLASIGSFCENIIVKATQQVNYAWDEYKRRIGRSIPKIASRADKTALIISLPRSGQYLRTLLHLAPSIRRNRISLHLPPLDDGTIRAARKLAESYFRFAEMDTSVKHKTVSTTGVKRSYQSRCVELAAAIDDLFAAACSISASKPEQMSSFILNLFEIWITMDKCAVLACSLLCEYHPIFPPEALDVLLLPTASEMKRLLSRANLPSL
jgi:hypothetical protein